MVGLSRTNARQYVKATLLFLGLTGLCVLRPSILPLRCMPLGAPNGAAKQSQCEGCHNPKPSTQGPRFAEACDVIRETQGLT